MALTAAQRQKRYRQRLLAAARAVPQAQVAPTETIPALLRRGGELAGMQPGDAEHLIEEIAAPVVEAIDLFLDNVPEDEDPVTSRALRDVAQKLAELIGEPLDPAPGLTWSAIRQAMEARGMRHREAAAIAVTISGPQLEFILEDTVKHVGTWQDECSFHWKRRLVTLARHIGLVADANVPSIGKPA